MKPLTDKHAAFVMEYRAHRNATRAYTAVYDRRGATARVNGARLLANARIREVVASLDQEQSARLEIRADEVLLDAARVIRADARELSQLHIGCCRYCYGQGHFYQRTAAEFNRAFEQWRADGETATRGMERIFDEQGGVGWDPRRPPLDACPECVGEGVERILLGDSRKLSAEAAALFDGVKRTKEGMQILTRNRDSARDVLARHFGLFAADNKQKSPPLIEALQELMKGMHARESGRLRHSPPRQSKSFE